MTTPLAYPTQLFQQPFAAGGGATNPIPIVANPTPGGISIPEGFPALTRTPIAAGGVPPSGLDMNGILQLLSLHTFWTNGGGKYRFNAALAAAIGGYPVGVVLQDDSGLIEYLNVTANNSTNFNSSPSSIGTNWIPWGGQNQLAAETGGSAANVYVATTLPAIDSYLKFRNFVFAFSTTHANTGACTINLGPSAIPLYNNASTALVAGDLPANTIMLARINGAGTAANIIGPVNSQSNSQWTQSGLTPTYIGATSFSLVGDQTANFQVGRRIKTTNTGGTIYSTISASVFSSVTTVTVVNDSGTLDSGLSAVSYSLLSVVNPAIPTATFNATRIGFADGSVGLPSVSFSSDLDCGMYRIGANNLGVAVNGAKVLDIGTAGLGVTGTFSATGVSTLAKTTASAGLYGGTTSPITNLGAGTNLQVLVATTGDFLGGFEHTHSTGPNGLYMIYTNSNPNDTTHPFLRCDSASSIVRFMVASNSGISNVQANNINLSDEKVKPKFEDYTDEMLDDLQEKFVSFRRGRFLMEGQTHSDWNFGLTAQSVEKVMPELTEVWNPTTRVKIGEDDEGAGIYEDQPTPADKQLKAVYSHDIEQIGQALLVRALKKIDSLEQRIAALEAKIK